MQSWRSIHAHGGWHERLSGACVRCRHSIRVQYRSIRDKVRTEWRSSAEFCRAGYRLDLDNLDWENIVSFKHWKFPQHSAKANKQLKFCSNQWKLKHKWRIHWHKRPVDWRVYSNIRVLQRFEYSKGCSEDRHDNNNNNWATVRVSKLVGTSKFLPIAWRDSCDSRNRFKLRPSWDRTRHLSFGWDSFWSQLLRFLQILLRWRVPWSQLQWRSQLRQHWSKFNP